MTFFSPLNLLLKQDFKIKLKPNFYLLSIAQATAVPEILFSFLSLQGKANVPPVF